MCDQHLSKFSGCIRDEVPLADAIPFRGRNRTYPVETRQKRFKVSLHGTSSVMRLIESIDFVLEIVYLEKEGRQC